MPQPVDKTSFSYSPRRLLTDRPKHSAGIGHVTSEWAALEENLTAMIVYALFSMSSESAPLAVSTMLDRIESITIRLEVIDGLLQSRISADDYKEYVEILRPEIRKRAGERNRVAHGHWQISDKFPQYVGIETKDGFFGYSTKDFEDIADRIIALSDKIKDYLMRLVRTDGVGPWNSMHD